MIHAAFRCGFYVVILLIAPDAAFANIGLPMMFITLPGMALGFLPIVAIETWVFCRNSDIPWRQAFKMNAVANLASTALGNALTWFALFVAQMAFSYPFFYFFGHPASLSDW